MTIVLFTPPYQTFEDANGNPLSGGFVYTYSAGTTTPRATYTDQGGLTPNANPVVLDSAGRADIWLDSSAAYKFIVKDSLGNTIKTTDNVSPFSTASGLSTLGTIASNTLIGNNTGSSITPLALTVAQVQTMLGISGGSLNQFRNGTMMVWQRGTSGTITAGSPSYTADGWYVGSTGANVTWSQVAGRANTAYALKVTGAASVTDVFIKQRIEGILCNVLYPQASAQVTVQAKVYNGTGGSITPTLTVKHATALDNWAGTTTDVSAVSLQACADATLTTVAYTFATASGTTNGLEVTIDFGNNFTTTGKSVEVTELDIRVTPGVSTGTNSSPPTIEIRNPQAELAFCQRYLYGYIASSGSQEIIAAGQAYTTTNVNVVLSLPVELRASSTGITVSNATHFGVFAANGANTALTNLAWAEGGKRAVGLTCTVASGLVAGNASQFYVQNASGQLLITGAEL